MASGVCYIQYSANKNLVRTSQKKHPYLLTSLKLPLPPPPTRNLGSLLTFLAKQIKSVEINLGSLHPPLSQIWAMPTRKCVFFWEAFPQSEFLGVNKSITFSLNDGLFNQPLFTLFSFSVRKLYPNLTVIGGILILYVTLCQDLFLTEKKHKVTFHVQYQLNDELRQR